MIDRNADESAISAFFTEKVRSGLPFIHVVEHQYNTIDDKCFITIELIRNTINLDLFKKTIQEETGVRNVIIHTRDKLPGFVIELDGNCKVIFLRRFHTPSKTKKYLFDFFIFLFMFFLIWMFF